MKIPKNAIVAVADGEILNLFRNSGDEAVPKLMSLPDVEVDASNKGSGGRHQSGAVSLTLTSLSQRQSSRIEERE